MAQLDRPFELPDLVAELYRLLPQIPRGWVTTYGDLAAALGDRRASRWVGAELLHHQHRLDCPCFRVVRASGEIGGFVTRNAADKCQALRREGIRCVNGRVDLQTLRFREFQGGEPLRQLRSVQGRVRDLVALCEPTRCDRIAGIDVSYRKTRGVAVYVELDAVSGEIVYQRHVQQPVRFPYIPTYLAFRELPIVLDTLERVRQEHDLADVLMVDGSGILHPLRAGVATMIGVYANLPTIGVTKKRLHGTLAWSRLQAGQPVDVTDPCEPIVLGTAILPTATTQRPIYISPGHQISVSRSQQLVRDWLRGRRLPEPIYWADRLSRAAARTL